MSAWAAFLSVRKVLIQEFRAEGKSCTEIARILSMDPGQVWLIADEAGPAPEDARQAIIEARDRGFEYIRRQRRKQR